MPAQDLLVQLFRHHLVLAVISLQLLQHRIPVPLNSAGTPYLSPCPLQSFPPIPCVGKSRCSQKWSFFVLPVPPLTLHHSSFGSTTGAALVSLHTHALVLPHLLRCSYQSCLGQHLSPAQPPLCSEGVLLSTVCTWAGLFTFSSAKKAASFREGFTWNSFVDRLQRCLSYFCSSFTAYLHFTKYSPMKLQKSK